MNASARPCPKCSQGSAPFSLSLWECRSCALIFDASGKERFGPDTMRRNQEDDVAGTETLDNVVHDLAGEVAELTVKAQAIDERVTKDIGDMALLIQDIHRRLRNVEQFIMGVTAESPRIERPT